MSKFEIVRRDFFKTNRLFARCVAAGQQRGVSTTPDGRASLGADKCQIKNLKSCRCGAEAGVRQPVIAPFETWQIKARCRKRGFTAQLLPAICRHVGGAGNCWSSLMMSSPRLLNASPRICRPEPLNRTRGTVMTDTRGGAPPPHSRRRGPAPTSPSRVENIGKWNNADFTTTARADQADRVAIVTDYFNGARQ